MDYEKLLSGAWINVDLQIKMSTILNQCTRRLVLGEIIFGIFQLELVKTHVTSQDPSSRQDNCLTY